MALGIGAPAYDVKAVTPNDSTDLPDGPCRALLVEVAGDGVIITAAGTTVTVPLQAGYNPIQTKRVKATLTTATGIFALY